MSLPELAPMLATLGSDDVVRQPGWHFEVKWDGYRALARRPREGGLVLRSRGGLDLAATYPELGELDGLLAGHKAIVDGEIVALLPDGRSDFEALQNHGQSGNRPAHFMAFDLLHLDGNSLLHLPYLERRELLEGLLGEGSGNVHVPTTFGDEGELALAASRQLRLEGLIAKRATSTYQPGRRTEAWLKVKNFWTQEVVVVGWKRGSGARSRTIGSLLVAVPDATGRLQCVGSAGSGFTDAMLDDAVARLRPLQRATNPDVANVRPLEARENTWVEPVLVGEVSYGQRTAQGRLRHPVWRGWRDDLTPAEVALGEG
ncbi:non-homologous end-joining DNA ligase [Luteococcus peritonei]|uniref:DNA ligase (ATP) n=1 Tax=Luteococcus peritonei TaxID=88874 RepID=A0ABW4RVH7_9ACTN